MNHWLEKSKRNLLPLSKATLFTEALSEWQFTGNVYDYDGKDIECELCEHPDLYHHYEIRNKLNENRLLVGSSCILKFSEINVKDEMGNLITEKEKRKEILYDSLKKKLIEIMIEPLRELWLKDKKNRLLIAPKAQQLKDDHGISPYELLFLFKRLEENKIPYSPERYKVSLRSAKHKEELQTMEMQDLDKIKLALSINQRNKYYKVINEK